MEGIQLKSNPQVASVFTNYPDYVRSQMLTLRELVLETAKEIDSITEVEETLKWGEPSYLTKIGSTLRMDWKAKTPNQYALYFKCTSRLVETFKAVFKNTFEFEGKRAIVFQLNNELPREELSYCIKAALTYHKVKHLPTLGI
ncbi:DUF1801 domain-containing protein [Zobellia alginiliquefaciens]|uniref:DUF1801 domain-containing protein n=1 Tax=Zobellia alginiliquefaciens TaxID=3032586 RepID=UPI0023E410F4|nr:DUF1801 domain-containing protein [Zobellia alginiliquefaciens]